MAAHPASVLALFSVAMLVSLTATAASGGWLAGVERELATREYRASLTAAGLQAPNRAHGLRTWFAADGIRVHDRTAAGSPELLALSLSGVGRGDTLSALASGEVTNDGARVEIRRPGIVEWYENSAAGLEQGFTLTQRPVGTGPLVLELALSGASARARGDELTFETRAGRNLAYGKLVALDAAKRRLDARFALRNSQRVRIIVDDAGADYPLVIDPLLTGVPDAQIESNIDSGELGVVAGAGDVNNDGFDDVIAAAPMAEATDGPLHHTNEGVAWVFLGSAAGIPSGTPSAASGKLDSNQNYAELGTSVAGAGDVNGDGYDDVIVGAPYYDAGQSEEGAAFIFLGGSAGIVNGNAASAAAQLESNQVLGALGYSVAGAGDVNHDGYDDVIVGAIGYDAGETNEGAAFVFLGSAAGIADGNPGTAAARLESDQANANLGGEVAAAGDVNGDTYDDVIVGARRYDSGESNEGAAFVFLGSAAGILDGDAGSAAAQLEANQVNAQLGWDVSGAGDVNDDGYDDVIVVALDYDAGETDEGAAFVFLGGAAGIADGNPGNASAQIETDQVLGVITSAAGAGDVNNDGYADVVVGARSYDSGQAGEGAAFVFLGTAAGIPDGDPGTAAVFLAVNQPGATFGTVAGAGDVNGDGYDDVIVGAIWFDGGQTDEGAVFVFHGSGGLAPNVDSDGDGLSNAAEQALGTNPLLADTDGDGLDDAREVNVLGTNPLSVDTDGDGRSDAWEINHGSDPNDPGSVPVPALGPAGLGLLAALLCAAAVPWLRKVRRTAA